MIRFLPLVIVICMYSCSSGNDKSDTTLLKEVNNSLLQSNRETQSSTTNIFESLKNKAKDPTTSEGATKWFSKSIAVRKLTDSIIAHIEKLKSDLIDEAGFDPLKKEKVESAREAVRHVFNEHKEGQLLHEKLVLYKNDLLAVDSTIRSYMANNISITGTDMISRGDSFVDRYFNTTLLGAITMLNKIENDIRFTENKFTSYCDSQISIHPIISDYPINHPLIGQSATVVKPGELITITAGIGDYSLNSQPSVKIAEQKIPINDYGFFEYELKTPSKAGDYTTSITIQYFDQLTGKKVEFKKTINYTVLSN